MAGVKGRYGVFCVRGYERDSRPLSTHRTVEAAEARAERETRGFYRQLGVQNALIAYEVYERVGTVWPSLWLSTQGDN
jgi:hypothetical protein